MNIQAYIKSGILEQYCLGLLNTEEEGTVIKMRELYPEIKQELIEIEYAIEHIASRKAVTPGNDIRQKILNSLGFSDAEELDIHNLPVAHKYSNHQSWLNVLKHLIPAEPVDDFLSHVIQETANLSQMLVITKTGAPKEIHVDIMESFLILKGECICTVGDETYRLNAGDFLEIPLHLEHDVKLLSPYVIAVVQYQPV